MIMKTISEIAKMKKVTRQRIDQIVREKNVPFKMIGHVRVIEDRVIDVYFND